MVLVLLQELAIIINRTKLKGLREIDFPFSDRSELAKLYQFISDNALFSETELLQALHVDNRKFHKLSAALSERLMGSLFLIDLKQSSYTDRQRAYYECYKDWAAAKILQGKNARRSAVLISERILRQAIRYEFTELSIDIARFLRMHYGAIQLDPDKYHRYAQMAAQFNELYAVEERIESAYVHLVQQFLTRQAMGKELSDLARAQFNDIEPLLSTYHSHNAHLYGRLIEMMIYTSTDQNERVLPVCDNLIAFFSAKGYIASVPLLAAYYQKMESLLELRRYDEQDMGIEKCFELLEEGSFNWFKYQETYLILLLHTQRYAEAHSIFGRAVAHKKFPYQPEALREYWRILEAYLHFLMETGQLPADPHKPLPPFKLGRFLNETPIYAKDRRGINISILIIQLLFLIVQRKYSQAVDKVDAIQRYVDKYLRQPETKRAYLFIKALLALPLYHFDRKAVMAKTDRYISELKEHHAKGAIVQSHLIEILPFEHQWELLASQLPNRL